MFVHHLTFAALLIAVGTLSAHIFYIPAGVAKCFPVQHAINVLAAVILGPACSVAIAFLISLLRNLLGFGSLLAFPGSMAGAFLAALLYKYRRTVGAAMTGEIIGTGLIGGLLAFPIANFILGKATAAWFFLPPFFASTIGGSIIAGLILKSGALSAISSSLAPRGRKGNNA